MGLTSANIGVGGSVKGVNDVVPKEGGGGKGRGLSDVVLDTSMPMRLAAREATLASVIPARKRWARNSRMSLCEI